MRFQRSILIAEVLFFLATFPIAAQKDETSYEAYEYAGINAEPAMTMQIYPSASGDTVVNDTLDPPGEEPRVVVGYWEYTEELNPDEIPCNREPTMKIAYPIDYGSKRCYTWKHWVLGDVDEAGIPTPHYNSAKNFACDDGGFVLEQWIDASCGAGDAARGVVKHAWSDRCTLDTEFDPDQVPNPDPDQTYMAIYSKILRGCGKEPPRRRKDAACDENTPRDDDAPYSVTLSFWYSSEIDDPSRIPDDVEPHQTMTFTWTNPQECFVWLRKVSGSDEPRLNVANAFSLEIQNDVAKFAYAQNGWVCCEEFDRIGVIKEFYSDRLILDETTGQQGDPSYVAVTEYRRPSS